VTVDSLRAAVHDSSGPTIPGGFQDVSRASDVDVVIHGLRDIELTKGGCDVMDDLRAFGRAKNNIAVRHRSQDDLSAKLSQLVREQPWLAVEADD